MAAIRRAEEELNFAAGLGRNTSLGLEGGWNSAEHSVGRVITDLQGYQAINSIAARTSIITIPMSNHQLLCHLQNEVEIKIFNALRNADQSVSNFESKVSFCNNQKKLTLKYAILTHLHSQALFDIINEYKIKYLDLSLSPNLHNSDILDFIAQDNNLHTIDLSRTILLNYGPHSDLPIKLGKVLSTNKTLKNLILANVFNLGSEPSIIKPITDGIASNDTLESLDLRGTAVIGANAERAQAFLKALANNRSLISLKLSSSVPNDNDTFNTIADCLDNISVEISINRERDSVQLAKQLVNHYLPNQKEAEPIYKSVSFLRHYDNSPVKLASLSHNLFKALWHANVDFQDVEDLIQSMMFYVRDLFNAHHLFDILGITKNLASQEHKLNGAKDSLYGVLGFLSIDDIKYLQIDQPAQEMLVAGASAGVDFEEKE